MNYLFGIVVGMRWTCAPKCTNACGGGGSPRRPKHAPTTPERIPKSSNRTRTSLLLTKRFLFDEDVVGRC